MQKHEGPVVIEGVDTGDGRIIQENAVQLDDALGKMRVTVLDARESSRETGEHGTHVVAGKVRKLERRGSQIWAVVTLDDDELAEHGIAFDERIAVGADLADAEIEPKIPARGDDPDVITSCRIAGLTLSHAGGGNHTYLVPLNE